MRLSAGVLLLGTLSTSWALPSLRPFAGAITGWFDPFGQLPLPKLGGHHSSEDKSVFDIISTDDKYTKITKAIKFAEGIESILKDSESSITFFAVPDSALKPPRRDHDHPHHRDLEDISKITSLPDAIQALDHIEPLGGDHDDDDKERKKKILKAIVTGILNYHILPEKLDGVELGKNNTYATNLALPKLFGERALRVRVSHSLKVIPPPPGGLTINWYSNVVHQDRSASNGVIHEISRPLLPPPNLFQELFFLPGLFSTLTSAIQRTDLTEAIDLQWKKGEDDKRGHLHGAKAATIFAPTNRAFERLPPKLKFFLFSPFGTRVLDKLLAYHVVPDYIFHTDYVFNGTSTDAHFSNYDDSELDAAFQLSSELGWPARPQSLKCGKHAKGKDHGHPDHKPISSYHVELPTALANHTISATVEKIFIGPRIPHHPRRIATILKANHRLVPIPDSVGFNGAVHVVDRILDPRDHGHDGDHDHHVKGDHDKNWEDWEDWLVKWADEA